MENKELLYHHREMFKWSAIGFIIFFINGGLSFLILGKIGFLALGICYLIMEIIGILRVNSKRRIL